MKSQKRMSTPMKMKATVVPLLQVADTVLQRVVGDEAFTGKQVIECDLIVDCHLFISYPYYPCQLLRFFAFV